MEDKLPEHFPAMTPLIAFAVLRMMNDFFPELYETEEPWTEKTLPDGEWFKERILTLICVAEDIVENCSVKVEVH